jgi:hypothetical protein
MRLISTIQTVGEGVTIAVPVYSPLLGTKKPNKLAIMMNNPEIAAQLRATREKNDAEMMEKRAIAARELAAIPIIQEEYDIGYRFAKNELGSLGDTDVTRAHSILQSREARYERSMAEGMMGYAESFRAKLKSREAGELQATKDWFDVINTNARIKSKSNYYNNRGTVAVSTTSAVATDTPPGKTSPLTIAAIGFAALKLLAII